MAAGCFQQVLFGRFLFVILRRSLVRIGRDSGLGLPGEEDGSSVKSAVFLAPALASV